MVLEVYEIELEKYLSKDALALLRAYERIYVPDIALTHVGGSMLDFAVEGGDLAIAGFFHNPTIERVMALAVQDILIRILSDREDSEYFENKGIGLREVGMDTDAIRSLVLLALGNSPYVRRINNLLVQTVGIGEIKITIDAVSVTGDSIGLGVKLSD